MRPEHGRYKGGGQLLLLLLLLLGRVVVIVVWVGIICVIAGVIVGRHRTAGAAWDDSSSTADSG